MYDEISEEVYEERKKELKENNIDYDINLQKLNTKEKEILSNIN